MNIFYYLHNFLFKVLWFKKLLKSTSLHYCYPIVSFLLKIQFLVSVMFGHLLFPYYVIFLHYEKEHSDSVSLLYEWMDLVKMLLAYDHALFFSFFDISYYINCFLYIELSIIYYKKYRYNSPGYGHQRFL